MRSAIVLLVSALALTGCAAEDIETRTEETADDTVGSIEQSLDSPCIQACMRGCTCEPGTKPPQCRQECRFDCADSCTSQCVPSCAGKLCGGSDGCGGLCSTGICAAGKSCGGGGVPNVCGCTPACSGQACGASDGCGGTCNSGSCSNGGSCGGAGVPGQCALLPNLNAVVTGTFKWVGFNSKQSDWVLTVRNLGPAAATNIKLLIQTNSPASLLQLQPVNGFSCYFPPGYGARLGLECVGGSVGAYNTAQITLTTGLSVSGYNVLSVFVDPDNTTQEVDETDNSANGGVFVP